MCLFFQAEDGIRDLVRSRGLGDVYKRQGMTRIFTENGDSLPVTVIDVSNNRVTQIKKTEKDGYSAVQLCFGEKRACLLYTSDAADERSSVDLGGRRIIKKKKNERTAKLRGST